MRNVMKREGGIGIAANQLGFTSSIIIVEDTVMINPKETHHSYGTELAIEGCLSLPNKIYNVKRPCGVLIEYLDKEGRACKESIDGLRGRVFQHELDHLNGITLANNPAATEIVQQVY